MKLDIQMFSTPYVVFEDIPSTETPIDSTNLNKIQTDCRDEIGSLLLLETTDKSSLVSAINENKRNIEAQVVESGSNANGNYVKYADGTMICYGEKSGETTWSDYWGFCKRSPDSANSALEVTFPQTFISTPIIQLTGNHQGSIFAVNVFSVSTTTLKVVAFKPTSVSSTSYQYSWLAIGKWK